MVAHARAAYPREACGLLLGRREGALSQVAQIVRGPNSHPRPESAFELDPGFLVALIGRSGPGAPGSGAPRHERPALELLGFWHTHPRSSAHPSRADLAGLWPGASGLIVGLGPPGPQVRSFRRASGAPGWIEEALLPVDPAPDLAPGPGRDRRTRRSLFRPRP